MKSNFEKIFGKGLLQSIPQKTGVYMFWDKEDKIIYVGKAKNLRNRLNQYRNATRKKIHRKMRLIIKEAASLTFEICENEKEALLLENRLIQDQKPTLNVSGAFSFMYPCLGLATKYKGHKWLGVLYTSNPGMIVDSEFELFGAFRSREIVKEAYQALNKLLVFIAHRDLQEKKKFGHLSYSSLFFYRQVDSEIQDGLISLFRGESIDVLGLIAEKLLEKPDARKEAVEIQVNLKTLKYFYLKEARKLRLILDKMSISKSYIPQEDRDPLFIRGNSKFTP